MRFGPYRPKPVKMRGFLSIKPEGRLRPDFEKSVTLRARLGLDLAQRPFVHLYKYFDVGSNVLVPMN